MILVDTSVWVDHLRHGDDDFAQLLDREEVLAHPHVIGELALGHMPRRSLVLASLRELPLATIASDAEVFDFIGLHGLSGLGIGYVDAHLLASVRLTLGARFWTRDRRLALAAQRLGVAYNMFS